MFYTSDLLSIRQGNLSVAWLAATGNLNLKKLNGKDFRKAMEASVRRMCKEVGHYICIGHTSPPRHFSLYLSSMLISGITRIYGFQVRVLYQQASDAFVSLRVKEKMLDAITLDTEVNPEKNCIKVPEVLSPLFGVLDRENLEFQEFLKGFESVSENNTNKNSQKRKRETTDEIARKRTSDRPLDQSILTSMHQDWNENMVVDSSLITLRELDDLPQQIDATTYLADDFGGPLGLSAIPEEFLAPAPPLQTVVEEEGVTVKTIDGQAEPALEQITQENMMTEQTIPAIVIEPPAMELATPFQHQAEPELPPIAKKAKAPTEVEQTPAVSAGLAPLSDQHPELQPIVMFTDLEEQVNNKRKRKAYKKLKIDNVIKKTSENLKRRNQTLLNPGTVRCENVFDDIIDLSVPIQTSKQKRTAKLRKKRQPLTLRMSVLNLSDAISQIIPYRPEVSILDWGTSRRRALQFDASVSHQRTSAAINVTLAQSLTKLDMSKSISTPVNEIQEEVAQDVSTAGPMYPIPEEVTTAPPLLKETPLTAESRVVPRQVALFGPTEPLNLDASHDQPEQPVPDVIQPIPTDDALQPISDALQPVQAAAQSIASAAELRPGHVDSIPDDIQPIPVDVETVDETVQPEQLIDKTIDQVSEIASPLAIRASTRKKRTLEKERSSARKTAEAASSQESVGRRARAYSERARTILEQLEIGDDILLSDMLLPQATRRYVAYTFQFLLAHHKSGIVKLNQTECYAPVTVRKLM